jgi:SAM-dependent methyltransferase
VKRGPNPEWPIAEEDWASYYEYAPAALVIRECVRLSAVRDVALPEPILDVGCGDGLFAKLAYPDAQVWGIDVNPHEVRRAQATKSYRTLVCADVCDVSLPAGFFGSAVANCSLEHVPDIERALANVRRALAPGAPFVLIVPTPRWTESLLVPKVLRSIGMGAAARAYGRGLDRVFRHEHLYDAEGWGALLARAGFAMEEVRPLVSEATSVAFDAMLPASTIAWVTKKLTGRWIAVPAVRPATAELARRAARAAARLGRDEAREGASGELLIVARAVGEAPRDDEHEREHEREGGRGR